MTENNFLNNNDIDVFTFGRPPVCIDIMKKVKGCDFDSTYKNGLIFMNGKLPVRYINIENLMRLKRLPEDIKTLTI